MTQLTEARKLAVSRTVNPPKKVGFAVWIPASVDEELAIDAAAQSDHRKRGNWLLIAAKEKIERDREK